MNNCSMANIYAIGDVVRGAMLAHKAEEEGVFVAESIAGKEKPHINYDLIPGIVYAWPEVAAVGKTEEALKEAGVEYKIGSFPMRALGRSETSGDIDGVVKVLADKKTDEVLGVHIVAARAADIIMGNAMEFRASAKDIARICCGHPTYTEALKEAALAATGESSVAQLMDCVSTHIVDSRTLENRLLELSNSRSFFAMYTSNGYPNSKNATNLFLVGEQKQFIRIKSFYPSI